MGEIPISLVAFNTIFEANNLPISAYGLNAGCFESRNIPSIMKAMDIPVHGYKFMLFIITYYYHYIVN